MMIFKWKMTHKIKSKVLSKGRIEILSFPEVF